MSRSGAGALGERSAGPAGVGARTARIGIVGTGFIARGLAEVLARQPDLVVARVLTRRPPADRCAGFDPESVTRSVDDLCDHADLVVECSGDVVHATDVIDRAAAAGLPVVTMNAEFHVTTGSHFVGRATLSEAEGDQPGSLAALREDALAMGFRPWVYGNVKRYLHPDPPLEDMRYWSRRQGLRIGPTIAFTDGTKLQIEQALVANGLDADIARDGLVGPASDDIEAAACQLAERARTLGTALSDYVLSARAQACLFLTATHSSGQQASLDYFKLGPGPFYTLTRNHHLCHLEIPKTIRRMLGGGDALLDNGSRPRIGVAAVAKRRLDPGQRIERGIGGFEVRGRALRIAEHPDHVPIGLLQDAIVTRRVEPGDPLGWDDVEVPDGLARRAWTAICERAVAAGPGRPALERVRTVSRGVAAGGS